ncbi:hypothetical protein HanRHA438_Chr10g0450571 [Helianthus annuus]|uniref:Uncharacterized protein n=1 Tax=Helianthus annuus TaxID=4232 RepID=A0A9K3N434_HELAN|nr:hypothetical protein HanXRQr2_Chr10g0438571 [Helianthus annuus]KAJ0513694.1 hypothetical protein HanHA300_Chr10g0360701 [Helianthus annuus]KAJ0521585.1 hypothetical protein HanIR_Chr10g0472651 [Helianthus annuus]KAJ0529796.1 hypothetical protein HanHA89_Chr10g0382131 [Helianthus annuus]KAJ0696671.1 hypothetical protein HanLR1_Chr10g0359891 [Helianthus annuus]
MRNSPEFAPFQDLIERRNWCLNNLRLSSKEAEALRQENVNLQMMNSELNKQLSQLQQVSVSDSVPVSSVANCFGWTRIGEKGAAASDKRVAHGVENVDPVKKTDVERVKLPKSISVRSNGYLKTVGASNGGSGRVRAARAVDRVKLGSDMVNSNFNILFMDFLD